MVCIRTVMMTESGQQLLPPGLSVNAAAIIRGIRLYLGQPISVPEPLLRTPLAQRVSRLDLTRLSMLTEALSWEARQVGVIPQGYPLRVDFVMKVIHRLLPWYTRPLQNFSRRSAELGEELGHQISVIAQTQSELLRRLDQLEGNKTPLAQKNGQLTIESTPASEELSAKRSTEQAGRPGP